MDGTRGPDLARGPDFADPWGGDRSDIYRQKNNTEIMTV